MRDRHVCGLASRAARLLVGLASVTLVVGCERGTGAMTPDRLEREYGVSGAYTDDVRTPDGTIIGTVVPVTLADGRQAQLVIPHRQTGEPHALYVQDHDGLHPVRVQESARDDVTRAPAVVGRRPEPPHANRRSWEKDALIIGGGAGGGALIGAVAGGKKGAGVGATAGGLGGLIYDLATRDKAKK